MRKGFLISIATALIPATATISLLLLMGGASSKVSSQAFALHPDSPPTVTEVYPSSSTNDLDTEIVITGTGFTAEFSDTTVITPPTVLLDGTSLPEVGWVSSRTLTSTVPWGMVPGVYTITVVNPDGGSGSLADAFTVTKGIGVWTTGGPYGGDIWYVMLHPVTPTWVYASTDYTGLFFSEDSAAHWQLMLRAPGHPGRLSFDSEDNQVMYFGYMEVLRSQNGGNTWEDITPHNFGGWEIRPFAHPISSGLVYASVSTPHWSPVGDEEGGIYRSEDWGESWVTVTTGLTDTHVLAIAFHPENPDLMLAGTRHGHIFLSADRGDTWNWVADLGYPVSLLYFNPFGDHEAWAVLGALLWQAELPFLYRSSGPDFTLWQPIDQDFRAASLTFHPTLSGTLWAPTRNAIYVSTDWGETWNPLESAPPDVVHVTFDPDNPDVVYAGSEHYGVFKSTDGGASWVEANEGLAGVVPDYLAVSPNDMYEVYASAAESIGMLRSDNGGNSWQSLGVMRKGYPWEGNPLAVDPFISNRIYLGEMEEGSPSVRISEDRGQTWRVVTMTLPSGLANWMGETFAVAPHPTISGRILAGVTFFPPDFPGYVERPLGGIYLSHDYGESWGQIELGQPISGVTELVYSPSDPQVIYAGTGGTGLLRSENGGQGWEIITSSLWSENQDVRAVAIHPQDPDTIYVSESGTVYVSRDAGETWTMLPLPMFVRDLVFAQSEPIALYAGAYRTTDGETWEQIPGVPSGASVRSLASGRDEERVVVYIGTSAGLAPSEAQAAGGFGLADERTGVIPGLGELMGGGVYRMTTRLLKHRVYLPLVFKGYEQ
jgi:photosystem II stability/assembly factor-like uncharacterized protein